MTRAETFWTKFISQLENEQPLIFHHKDGNQQLPHTNFLGSIEAYRKVFMRANQPKSKK